MGRGRLTDLQMAFIDEYVQSLNATEAARRAGYSEKTASSIGWENLRKPQIREEINARLEERALQAEEVLSRLADQARGIPADCFDIHGGLIAVNFDRLRERGLMHLIKKLSYDSDGRPRVELYDAQAALVHIGKALNLFRETVEHTGADGGPIEIVWPQPPNLGDSNAE